MYPTGEREVTWAMTIYSISTRAEEHSTSAIPFRHLPFVENTVDNPVDNPVQRENFRYYLPDTDEPVDNRRTGPDLSLPKADRPDFFSAGTVTDRVHGMLFHDRCLIIHHRILSVLLFPARLLTINAFQGIHADRIYKRPDDSLSLFPLWRNNNHQRSQTDNGPVPE